MAAEFATQIATAQAALAQNNNGFQVEIVSDTPQSIPSGPGGAKVSFDTTDFDITNNVTNANTFTVQSPGSYAIAGVMEWDLGASGTRTVTVFKNGTPIFTASTIVEVGPVSLPFSTMGQFVQDDVVTVFATHSLGTSEAVLAGSTFSMIQFPEDPTAGGVTGNDNVTGTTAFTAKSNFPAMTVVKIDSALDAFNQGKVMPIDPTTVVMDGGGNVVYPFADGITLGAATTDNLVTTGVRYGNIFSIPGLGLTVGGLLFVGPGGLITQDYATLITEVQWVICVGRAVSADSFMWEPHIPNRFNMAF
jgi:hypothetical protein